MDKQRDPADSEGEEHDVVPGEGLDNVGAEDADTSDGDAQSERAEK